MLKHYTVATFRKQLREALNQADEGIIVTIDRYGSTYELTNIDNKPKKQDVQHLQTAPTVSTILKGKNVHTVQKQPQVINNLPTAMPTTLEEANDPGSPGYSAKITPDVIKTPTEAVNKIKTLPKKEPWSGPISKQYSSRKKGKERHVDL